MTTTINASPTNGLVQTADGSGVLKVQSNGVTTNALAWVNFNGTGTVAIRSSYNVSSITDNGTGDYTINFATALSDANYAVLSTGIVVVDQGSTYGFGVKVATVGGAASLKSTTQVTLLSRRDTSVDIAECNVAIFGN